MKKILTLVAMLFALAVPVIAQDPTILHDCRISRIDLKGTLKSDGVHIKAYFYAYDGSILSSILCPDQLAPTWGSDYGVELVNAYNAILRVEGTSRVAIATIQKDRSFYKERVFTR